MPQTINIKCPGCGVVLRVTNSKDEAEKRIACPKCGKRLIVPFYKLKPEDGETQLDGKEGSQSTQMCGDDLLQSCYLLFEGKEYELSIGSNTVGRLASTSIADVQIETDDLFMSREHAVINVRRLPNGGLKIDISNFKNKNTTKVNDYRLESDDAIVLHDGDTVEMGSTSMTFHTK